MDTIAPPAVGGNRLTWRQVPQRLRTELESAVGGSVIRVVGKDGGFSPGLASVLALSDGRSVFAKGVSMARNEFAVGAIRREIQVLAVLPDHVPAPRLLWSFDDGEWVVLVTEAVDGHNPALPWRSDELGRFLAAAVDLAHRLTPSPIAAPLRIDAEEFQSWTRLAGDPRAADGLDPRVRRLVDRLAALEQPWHTAAAGTALLHGDLRSDNFLLTSNGFVVVDWPSVCLGAPWLDLFLSLPSVAMHGGGDPQLLWESSPLSGGVDPDAANTVLAAAAGLFISRSLEPVPPLLPTIRVFQRAQGMAALDWLSRRLGWAQPG